MRRFFSFFILLLCFLPACSSVLPRYAYTRKPYNTEHTRYIPVYIDKNFSISDDLLADDAIRAWNYALNGYIQFNVVSTNFDMASSDIQRIMAEDGIAILKINSSSTLVPPEPDGDQVLAFTANNRWIYMIRDREVSDRMFVGVLSHEIAHTLGVSGKHINPFLHHSLMNPGYSDAYTQCIDRWTMLVIAQMQWLDISKLNYCEYEHEEDN